MRTFEIFGVKNKKQISIISAAHGFNEFYAVVLPPVLPPLVADFGISYGQAGFLITVFFSMYAVFQLPAGILADKLGQMRLLLGGMVMLLAGIFLVAVADSYKMLIAAQLLAGIGGSTYHPTGMSLISDLETKNTEGRAMGIHGFGGMIGVSAAPVLIGGIASIADWRIALLVACVLGAAATVVIYFAFSDRVQKETSAESATEFSVPTTDEFVEKIQSVFQVPLTGWVILLLVVHVAVSLQVRSVQTFTTTYVFAQRTGSTSIANGAFFVLIVGGSLSSLWFGDLADRFSRGLLGAGVSVVTAVLLFGTVTIGSDTSLPLLFPWFFAIGITLYAPSPVKNALASEYSSKNFSGSLFGLMQTASAVGGAAGPMLFGIIAERVGEVVLFPAIAIVCLLTGVVFLSLWFVSERE